MRVILRCRPPAESDSHLPPLPPVLMRVSSRRIGEESSSVLIELRPPFRAPPPSLLHLSISPSLFPFPRSLASFTLFLPPMQPSLPSARSLAPFPRSRSPSPFARGVFFFRARAHSWTHKTIKLLVRLLYFEEQARGCSRSSPCSPLASSPPRLSLSFAHAEACFAFLHGP